MATQPLVGSLLALDRVLGSWCGWCLWIHHASCLRVIPCRTGCLARSPFQYEVAYANLTIGILGFSSFLYRKRDDLLASMVASASWVFADGIADVVSLVADQNNAPSNAGTVLYGDLLTPLLALLLLWMQSR